LEQGSESIAVAGWYSGLRPGVSSAPGCRLPLPGKFLPLALALALSRPHPHLSWWVVGDGWRPYSFSWRLPHPVLCAPPLLDIGVEFVRS
jgi:hypothetical protein